MVKLLLGDGKSTAAPVQRDAAWWVEVVDSADAADRHLTAWDDLAWHAAEPNPFYEAWMLLPNWRHLGTTAETRLVLIYRSGVRPQDPPELCGLVPLQRRRHDQLPVTCWGLWHNDFICNCTPLLRQGVATRAWQEFCDWLSQQRLHLLQLPLVHAAGAFQQAFLEVTQQRHSPWSVDHQYSRALLLPADNSEAYCAQSMSCHNRQELRRQRRRLSEQGEFEVRITRPGEDLSFWIDEFLRLESAGWKGRAGTALAQDQATLQYLRELIFAAGQRNQVVLLGLFLNQQAIALKLNFTSGNGGFTFKIAYDEAYRRYSPGVQLELENVEWFHGQNGLEWMDSCARPDHFMIGRLWKHRRIMQRLTLSTGTRRGDLLVGSLMFLRSAKAALRRRPRPAQAADAPAKAEA